MINDNNSIEATIWEFPMLKCTKHAKGRRSFTIDYGDGLFHVSRDMSRNEAVIWYSGFCNGLRAAGVAEY